MVTGVAQRRAPENKSDIQLILTIGMTCLFYGSIPPGFLTTPTECDVGTNISTGVQPLAEMTLPFCPDGTKKPLCCGYVWIPAMRVKQKLEMFVHSSCLLLVGESCSFVCTQAGAGREVESVVLWMTEDHVRTLGTQVCERPRATRTREPVDDSLLHSL